MSTTKSVPSLKALYNEQVVPALVKSRGYKNKHEIPQIVKISLNTGIDAEADKNQIADIQRDLGLIAGQKPVLSKSRKAVSNFKLRQGQVVGAYVTLRGDTMWEFLYRLVAVALPTIRDFRGIPPKLDGRGNYNLGISDFTIFPEIVVENVKKTMGLDIAITTTAETDEEGRELLKLLGMPFRRTEQQIAAEAAAAKAAA
ncbi:ribosomal protein L5 [Opitutaceae bacterium TAV1]|nr:50S ribosomal protein L5 [Opitutaceae bacterium TAV5]EIQ02047.1 ribosomal protein L5 [Opitutaceae bacterium TAV1]